MARRSFSISVLYQVCNMLFPITVQQVNERNLNHCVATGSLAHCGTCTAHKNLGCERRIVYAHIELEQLVLCCARNALAGEVHAMSHVEQVVDARNLLDVCLVVDKVWVGLDGCSNLVKVVALLNLNIYHAAMYACANWDCH